MTFFVFGVTRLLVTTELELKAKDKTTMSLFGHGAPRMKAPIEAAMAAARP